MIVDKNMPQNHWKSLGKARFQAWAKTRTRLSRKLNILWKHANPAKSLARAGVLERAQGHGAASNHWKILQNKRICKLRLPFTQSAVGRKKHVHGYRKPSKKRWNNKQKQHYARGRPWAKRTSPMATSLKQTIGIAERYASPNGSNVLRG